MTKVFFKGNKVSFALTMFFTVIQSVVALTLSLILKEMMNTISGTENAKSLPEIAMMIGTFFIAFTVLYIALAIFKPLFMKKAVLNYREYYTKKILNLSHSYFKKEDTSNLISELTNDVNTIETGYLESIFSVIENIIYFFGSLALMLYVSPALTGIVALLILIPAVVSMATGRTLVPLEKKVSDKNAEMVGMIKDCFTGFSVVKSFQAENEIFSLIRDNIVSLENTKCVRNRRKILVTIIGAMASLFAQFGVFFAGVWMVVANKGMDAGTVILFVNLMNYIVSPISTLPSLLASVKSSKGLIEKLENSLKEEENTERTEECNVKVDNGIEIKNLSFGYEEGKEVLHDISLKFEPGKSYVIVGNSGSGKSTLLSLLKGGNDNYTGSITLDGKNIKNITYSSLLALVSDVEQNVFVFDAPVRDNITMFKSFPDKEVKEAEERSNLLKLVSDKGDLFKCGENGKFLSGGEKQRISIARALLKKSGIIIADEPWAALDKENSYLIAKDLTGIDDAIKIVVSHALDKKILSQFDEIIALRDGKVEETGTFDELINSRGYFSALYTVAQ